MEQTDGKKAAYEDLQDISDSFVGEIVNGEVTLTPRPSRKHCFSASALGGELIPAYQFGRGGGPGGWIILAEPEIKFGEDYLVPDMAGWRRERFPVAEETNWVSVRPDWICEILSPATVRLDRIKKMAVYARHKVPYLWLLDPQARTLEVFLLDKEVWILKAVYGDRDRVRAEPFDEIEIDLAGLWLE